MRGIERASVSRRRWLVWAIAGAVALAACDRAGPSERAETTVPSAAAAPAGSAAPMPAAAPGPGTAPSAVATAPSEPSEPEADTAAAEPPPAADPRAGAFIKAIAGAAPTAIFKGLPHPGPDREAFDRERRTKPVKELHGYWFHQKPHAHTAAEGKELSRLLSAPATYVEFSGEKKCGGFHPNFAVEWKQGEKIYRALICFSCHEIKLFGPGIETRHDLESEAYRAIVTRLGGDELLPRL